MSGLDTILGYIQSRQFSNRGLLDSSRALLIGTWADSLLYSVEILQAVYYFRHFKNDSWMLKLVVLSAITIDTVSMLGNYASVYLPIILYLFTTGIVAALVQSFLVIRYWSLAKNVFIAPILFCFIMVAIGGAFASAVTIATFPTYKDRGKVIIPATTWLVAEAVTDISIALALLFEFRKVKTSFQETKRRAHFTYHPNRGMWSDYSVGHLDRIFDKQPKQRRVSQLPKVPLFFVAHTSQCPWGSLSASEGGKKWSGNETSSGGTSMIHAQPGSRARSKGSDGGIRAPDVQVHIDNRQDFSTDSFKPNPGPNTNPGEDIEMAVQDPASYSSKRKQGLFAA
ncbi:hypothetical protein C8R44DRAFT_933368 [Mycena epipterygia]|nr:hypothetical protein C8R44DRAFT_933368 [Mycena epipterygia]